MAWTRKAKCKGEGSRPADAAAGLALGRCSDRFGNGVNAIQYRLGKTLILGEHFARSVASPVRAQSGIALRELAIVEDEQELAASGSQTLNRVRNAGGEEPEITRCDIVNKTSSRVVDTGHPRFTVDALPSVVGTGVR